MSSPKYYILDNYGQFRKILKHSNTGTSKMNSLPENLENKIFNFAAQMVLAERNKIWNPLHAEFRRTIWRHAEPYITLSPDLFRWGLCLRHGPYKHLLILEGLITEELCPLDL